MGRRTRSCLSAAAALLAAAIALPAHAAPFTDAALAAQLHRRFDQDRSGACVLAAAIDGTVVARARVCARPRADGGPAGGAAFEIGSISKTMTAFLLADLMAGQGWSLDDTLASRLPDLPGGAEPPRQGERQILLRDIATHSTGLPRLPGRFPATDRANPYASLGTADLLASLAQARLQGAIGTPSGYSNFAVMLLSLAVARGQAQAHGSADLEQALQQRLFAPLGMHGAYLLRAPAGALPAQGHDALGRPVPAWTWAAAPDLAGVGGVRATLDDMVLYAQALLGVTATPLAGRLQATLQPQAAGWGMQWMLSSRGGHNHVLHDGATGGFSSVLVLEPASRRAVVLLADTALGELGGLGRVAAALLDPAVAMPPPRVQLPVPAVLLAAAPGDYDLAGLAVRVWADNGRLLAQPAGQPVIELLYDSQGDLYPAQLVALLRPAIEDGQVTRFAWHQGGTVLQGVRKTPAAPAP